MIGYLVCSIFLENYEFMESLKMVNLLCVLLTVLSVGLLYKN